MISIYFVAALKAACFLLRGTLSSTLFLSSAQTYEFHSFRLIASQRVGRRTKLCRLESGKWRLEDTNRSAACLLPRAVSAPAETSICPKGQGRYSGRSVLGLLVGVWAPRSSSLRRDLRFPNASCCNLPFRRLPAVAPIRALTKDG